MAETWHKGPAVLRLPEDVSLHEHATTLIEIRKDLARPLETAGP